MPEPENNNDFLSEYGDLSNADPNSNREVPVAQLRELVDFRRHFGKDFDHKSFDPKRYSELKDIDPADYKDMKGFIDVVESDDRIYDVVKEMIAAKREGREADFSRFSKAEVKAGKEAAAAGAGGAAGKAAAAGAGAGKNGAGQGGEGGDNAGLSQRLSRLEQERINEKFWGSFDDVVKDIKLSTREKGLVERLVLQAYRENDRLGLADLKKTVDELIKSEIEPLRQEIAGGRATRLLNSEDGSPAGMHGGGASTPGKKYDPAQATPEERVSQMRRELRESGE
ncbi:MAG: hypothetical protein MOGMAGMI_02009 [Candidatus Omnitrophica bacterium]|nr:hypothetical protein [Candidatus Omnitrophota bacterium]